MTATPPPRLRHRLEAAAVRLVLGRLARRDIDAASDAGAKLLRRIGPMTGAHRTAAQNLAFAMPDLSVAERESILTGAWDNLGRTTAEYAVLPRLWREGAGERIAVSGHEALIEQARANKPVLLFSGHLGNWEIIPL